MFSMPALLDAPKEAPSVSVNVLPASTMKVSAAALKTEVPASVTVELLLIRIVPAVYRIWAGPAPSVNSVRLPVTWSVPPLSSTPFPAITVLVPMPKVVPPPTTRPAAVVNVVPTFSVPVVSVRPPALASSAPLNVAVPPLSVSVFVAERIAVFAENIPPLKLMAPTLKVRVVVVAVPELIVSVPASATSPTISIEVSRLNAALIVSQPVPAAVLPSWRLLSAAELTSRVMLSPPMIVTVSAAPGTAPPLQSRAVFHVPAPPAAESTACKWVGGNIRTKTAMNTITRRAREADMFGPSFLQRD